MLQGHGDGTFSPPTQTLFVAGLEGGFPDLALANLNADAWLDIIAASPQSQALAIALGDGPLHFAAPEVIPIGITPVRVIAQDVTRDATADVLVASQSGIGLLRGRGDGSFESSEMIGAGELVADLAVADIDGDHLADIVAAVPARDTLQVYRGVRDGGGFVAGAAAEVDEPIALAVGELSGDTRFDIAVVAARSGRIVVFPGGATGLGAPVTVASQISATDLFAADLNGDAREDLTAVDAVTGAIRVLVGGANLAFTVVPTSGGMPGSGVALADFDCDGRADVAMTPPGAPSSEVLPPPVPPAPTPCAGDCDHDAMVHIDEVIVGVRISLGDPFLACAATDRDRSGRIDIAELIASVQRSQAGCSEASANAQ